MVESIQGADKEMSLEERLVFLDDHHMAVCGGKIRLIEISNELIRRGYPCVFYLKDLRRIDLYNDIEIMAPTELAPEHIKARMIFLGDSSVNFGKFMKADAQKVWLLQGIFLPSKEKYYGYQEQEIAFNDPSIKKITFTKESREWFEETYRQKTIFAPGGINLSKFKSLSLPRKSFILTSSKHRNEIYDILRPLLLETFLTMETIEGKTDLELIQAMNEAQVIISGQKRIHPLGNIVHVWNNIVAQGMACQTPVVSYKEGTSTEFGNHLETLYLAETLKDFEKGVRFFLENEEKRKEIVKQAYSLIQNYTWAKVVDRIEDELLKE